MSDTPPAVGVKRGAGGTSSTLASASPGRGGSAGAGVILLRCGGSLNASLCAGPCWGPCAPSGTWRVGDIRVGPGGVVAAVGAAPWPHAHCLNWGCAAGPAGRGMAGWVLTAWAARRSHRRPARPLASIKHRMCRLLTCYC